MIDRAAIFEDVLRRNALREQALLPPLEIRAEFDRAVAVALFAEYRRLAALHPEQRDRFVLQARAEFAADHPAMSLASSTACIVVSRRVAALMRAFVAKQYELPAPNDTVLRQIRYGGG